MRLQDLTEGETHTDDKGRVWEIIARHPGDGDSRPPTFLAKWNNKDGYKNVALFVQFPSGLIEIASIDGPFSTPEMRAAWNHEKGYK